MKNIIRLKNIKGKLKLLYICIITTVLLSCQKSDEIEIDSENLLLGVWTNQVYNSNTNTTTFERVEQLPNEKYGISFHENGTYINRSSGWCGTPPLTFFNIEGTFVLKKDIIKVSIQDFSGDFQWKIIELNESKLIVKRELTDQEKDHRNLMEMFNEIQELSTSVSCTDNNDWNFVAYGSKACGGPQGYIAYSNKIDTTSFVKKVTDYTELEDKFNEKWNIVSDCSLPVKPLNVNCENGYPVLKY